MRCVPLILLKVIVSDTLFVLCRLYLNFSVIFVLLYAHNALSFTPVTNAVRPIIGNIVRIQFRPLSYRMFLMSVIELAALQYDLCIRPELP